MKRVLILLLSAVLCVSLFAGCAPAEIDEALVGTWNMQLDMAKPLVDSLKQNKMDALLDKLDLSSTKIDISFTFRQDATYAADVDVGAIEKLSKATAQAVAAMPELEKQLKDKGLDISGVTKLLTTLFPEKKEGDKKATVEGKYKVEDGKLFFGLGKTVTIFGSDGCTYTVEDDTLTVTAIDGKTGEGLKSVLPMTFKKA